MLLAELTDNLSYSAWHRGGGQSPLAYWPWQCVILSIISFLALWASCLMARRAALRHLVPKTQRVEYKMPPRQSKTYWLFRPFFLHAMVKRTIGTGLIWKEFVQPVLGKYRKVVFVSLVLLVAGFVVGSLAALTTGGFGPFMVVVSGSVLGLLVLSVLFTVIIPATSITAEKEAGTWLVLLTTCYSDYGILGGKLVGIARRIIVVWSPFLFIGALAAYVSQDSFAAYWWLIAVMGIAAGFVAASGLYFSSRFTRSNTAVICNLALTAVLWVAIPFVLFALQEIFRDLNSYMMSMLNIRFAQLYWTVTVPGVIETILERAPHYRPGLSNVHLLKTSAAFFITHFIAIALFLWRAKANLRKRIV
jgi:heme exporter protein D